MLIDQQLYAHVLLGRATLAAVFMIAFNLADSVASIVMPNPAVCCRRCISFLQMRQPQYVVHAKVDGFAISAHIEQDR